MAGGRGYLLDNTAACSQSGFLDGDCLLWVRPFRRSRLTEIYMACAVPSDLVFDWSLGRAFAVGIPAPLTPVPLDPADPAPSATGWSGPPTGAYTFLSLLGRWPLNCRDAHQWSGEGQGTAFYNNSSSGLAVVHESSTAACHGTIRFSE